MPERTIGRDSLKVTRNLKTVIYRDEEGVVLMEKCGGLGAESFGMASGQNTLNYLVLFYHYIVTT